MNRSFSVPAYRYLVTQSTASGQSLSPCQGSGQLQCDSAATLCCWAGLFWPLLCAVWGQKATRACGSR